MEMMTISSLSGIGLIPLEAGGSRMPLAYIAGLPGTGLPVAITTYADAISYIDGEIGNVLSSINSKLVATNTAPARDLLNQWSAIQAKSNTLAQDFSGKSGLMTQADKQMLLDLDSMVRGLDSASSNLSQRPLWVGIAIAALGLAAAGGAVVWLTRNLPSYARKRRRRR